MKIPVGRRAKWVTIHQQDMREPGSSPPLDVLVIVYRMTDKKDIEVVTYIGGKSDKTVTGTVDLSSGTYYLVIYTSGIRYHQPLHQLQ